jgi:excisionase family DNA binding protein
MPELNLAELWEVAAVLAVSEKTVKRMCQEGRLPHTHVGKRRQYRVIKPAPGKPWEVEPSEATRCPECWKPPRAPTAQQENAAAL